MTFTDSILRDFGAACLGVPVAMVVASGCSTAPKQLDCIDVECVYGAPDVVIEEVEYRRHIHSADGRSQHQRWNHDGGGPAFPWYERMLVYRDRDLEVTVRDGEVIRVGPIEERTRTILAEFDKGGLESRNDGTLTQ